MKCGYCLHLVGRNRPNRIVLEVRAGQSGSLFVCFFGCRVRFGDRNFVVSAGFAQTLEENWDDFISSLRANQLDLAKEPAQAIIGVRPKPIELLAVSTENLE